MGFITYVKVKCAAMIAQGHQERNGSLLLLGPYIYI